MALAGRPVRGPFAWTRAWPHGCRGAHARAGDRRDDDDLQPVPGGAAETSAGRVARSAVFRRPRPRRPTQHVVALSVARARETAQRRLRRCHRVQHPGSQGLVGASVERVAGQYVSGNFHAVVGVPFELGRGFADEDDRRLSPIAVISDGYWARQYGRSRDVIGKTLIVEVSRSRSSASPRRRSTACSRDSRSTSRCRSRCTSLPIRSSSPPQTRGRACRSSCASGRMSMPPSPQRHRLHLPRLHVAARSAAVQPDGNRPASRGDAAARGAGIDRLRRGYEAALYVLAAMVSLVLVVARVNVANLLLTRAPHARGKSPCACRSAPGVAGSSGSCSPRACCSPSSAACSACCSPPGAAVRLVLLQWGCARSHRPPAAHGRSAVRGWAVDSDGHRFRSGRPGRPAASISSGRSRPERAGGPAGGGRANRRWSRRKSRSASCSCSAPRCSRARCATCSSWTPASARPPSCCSSSTREIPRFHASGLKRSAKTSWLGSTVDGMSARAPTAMSPVVTNSEGRPIAVPGFSHPQREVPPAFANSIDSGYFETFGVDVVRGRQLTPADHSASSRVAVLSEGMTRSLLRRCQSDRPAFRFGGADPITVVGVTRDARQNGAIRRDMATRRSPSGTNRHPDCSPR